MFAAPVIPVPECGWRGESGCRPVGPGTPGSSRGSSRPGPGRSITPSRAPWGRRRGARAPARRARWPCAVLELRTRGAPGQGAGTAPVELDPARTGERMSDEFTRPPSVRPARRPAARRTCRAARRRGRQPDRQRPRLPAAHRARAGDRPARRSRRRDRHGGCHRHRHAAGPPGGRPRPRAGLRPARPYPHHQADQRRHRELRAAHRVHADPPGARGRRHRARPGSALSRRRLRGRGVLGGDPAGHGVVGPGSPRSHERSDPVDGALGPGLGRLRRGGAAHRARPGALRGVGLACPLPPRRRLLAGHARPLPHPRRRCAAVPPAAPLVGGGRGRHRRGARRALGGRLLAGLQPGCGCSPTRQCSSSPRACRPMPGCRRRGSRWRWVRPRSPRPCR